MGAAGPRGAAGNGAAAGGSSAWHGSDQASVSNALGQAELTYDPPSTQGLFSDINITPLVDVVLVLLILFMVSSSAMVDAVREGRLDLSLPQSGEAEAAAPDAEVVVVGMDANGQLFVQGRPINEAELLATLVAVFAEAPHSVVVLDADGSLSHAKVVHLLDQVRKAGFRNVGFGAEQMQ